MTHYTNTNNPVDFPKTKEKQMNERIRELLNEATSGLDPDVSEQRTVTLNEMEKFAELIVRECVKICNDTNDASYLNGIVAGRKIKQHFGVEE